jgi:glycosyltransferase involved in cell wall biosynthesis
VSKNSIPLGILSRQCLFLVWGPPSHGPRSQVLARELNIEQLHFIYLTTKRGLLSAPFKYTFQAVKTLLLLFSKRPKFVFVQSPPGFAPLVVYIYAALSKSHFLVDAHSGAFLYPYWTHPKWLYRLLARKAVTTIVTNEYFQKIITDWGGHSLILRDIPTTFPKGSPYPMNGDFNLVVVNTFSVDEPLDEIIAAAAGLKHVKFYITGKKKMAKPALLDQAPGNVQFTDFLPNDKYYGLLESSDAILCLTTQDNTMQRGACEALSLGKPIITSDWPLLREYFRKGTIHVANNSKGITDGVLNMIENHEIHQRGIKELQVEQQQEWQEKLTLLRLLIHQANATQL